jgi:Ca-activated chloride channel family protein
MKLFPKILLFILAINIVVVSNCQQKSVRNSTNSHSQKTRILFILDCSYSMYGKWESDTKIKITQSILSNVIDSLEGTPNLELALRAYGHTKNYLPQDCNDTKLEVPFSKRNTEQLKSKLKALVPQGTTPITNSLEAAKGDFPECSNCRNIIIMIVDGVDDCGNNPCEVSQRLQQKGKIIKPFIIGIGRGFKEHFQCVGNYIEATNEIEFSIALNDVVNQAINSTTCQVDLLDIYKSSTETNVPMIFYETKSKLPKYSFIHTLNSKGLSDTIEIDPLINYDIEIQTLPKVVLENINFKAGKHTIIKASAPQGILDIRYKGKQLANNKPVGVLIKKSNEEKTLNLQNIGSSERYLIGKYNLEVLTQPNLILKDVEIGQSSTTTIEIPSTGIVQITKPMENLATIFVNKNNKWEFVTNLPSDKQIDNILLLPGEYQIVLRAKQSTEIKQTKVKEFKIESGETTILLLDNKKTK